MKASTDHLTIEPTWPSAASCVLRLVGELDIAAVGEAAAAVALAQMSGAESLLLDLRDLELIDSAGLRFLLEGEERARNADIRFAVVADEGSVVRRMLDLTLLTGRLLVVDDPAQALPGPRTGGSTA